MRRELIAADRRDGLMSLREALESFQGKALIDASKEMDYLAELVPAQDLLRVLEQENPEILSIPVHVDGVGIRAVVNGDVRDYLYTDADQADRVEWCESCAVASIWRPATTYSENPEFSEYNLCYECAAEYDSRIK